VSSQKRRDASSWQYLEELVLKSHVGLWLKANAGTEDVGQGTALLSESVDNWSALWDKRSLKHVGEDAQNGVESLVVLGGGTVIRVRLPGDTGHQLGDQNQIDDQWRGKERVLADIEEAVKR